MSAPPVDATPPSPAGGGGGGGDSSQDTLCPLCQAMVPAGDTLQLHYLTSCSGYDKGEVEEGEG